VKAVNLIDGMDALAASVVVASAIGFALMAEDVRIPAVAVCGALVGFLVFNRPPARIYLGDGGSYLLGTSLALLAARSLGSHSRAAWVAIPLFVALPLADTTIAVVRRARSGRSLLAGDRSHVYDQLADRGWPVPRVVAALVAVQLLAVVGGVVCLHLQLAASITLAAAAVVGLLVVVWRMDFVRREAPT